MGERRTWTSRPGRRPRPWWAVPAGALAAVALALAAAVPQRPPGERMDEGAAVEVQPSPTRADRSEEPVFDAAEVTAWLCPVRGIPTFRDDFGYVQHDGSRHRGVDLYAPSGTPVVANVPGVVERREGPVAGLHYRLEGDDGRTYIGAHLSAIGDEGRVGFGDVIGYVGDSGNAIGGPPHLHFEVREEGVPVNPFPWLDDACA